MEGRPGYNEGKEGRKYLAGRASEFLTPYGKGIGAEEKRKVKGKKEQA